MDWSSLPQLIVSVAGTVGVARLLEVVVTRRKQRVDATKVEVDAGLIISTELRAWAAEARAEATARVKTAEDRADSLLIKLSSVNAALDVLEGKIARCQAGPICPVRTQ